LIERVIIQSTIKHAITADKTNAERINAATSFRRRDIYPSPFPPPNYD